MSQEAVSCYARPDLMHFRKASAYLDGVGCGVVTSSASLVSTNPCLAQKQASRGPVKLDNSGACCLSSTSGCHLPDAVPLQGNLLDASYRTDEFRINCFKVSECTNPDPHDWTLCAFAHVGEKAKRRDPAIFKYVATACPDFRKGTCKRGDGCPFAHGVFETWLHPGRYRTQLCKDGLECDRPVCFFAHTIQELRTPSLPTSLANSPDGMAFAAFFGGPTYASLLQQVPRPPACLPQQQQHMMPGFSLSTAAAVLHQQQLQLGQQLQMGVLQQQPSSPQSSESSLGGAALVPSESFPGSDEDWAALCAAQKHLRRAAAAVAAAAEVQASAPQQQQSAPVSQSPAQSVLMAWLLSRGCASSEAMRMAAELGSHLDAMPNKVHAPPLQGPKVCPDLGSMLPSSSQAGPLHGQQLQVPPVASAVPVQPALGLGALQAAGQVSLPISSCPASQAVQPMSVPPALSAIWSASSQEISELQALLALRDQLNQAAGQPSL